MFLFPYKGLIYLPPPKVALESLHNTALPRRDAPHRWFVSRGRSWCPVLRQKPEPSPRS